MMTLLQLSRKNLCRVKSTKTDGYQLSRALLLSDKSKFLSKPELEIYADDVNVAMDHHLEV